MTRVLLAAFALCTICSPLIGETPLKIAVASNFHQSLREIVAAYQKEQPQSSFVLIPGSSGKLYAQIANGADFDAFFSADSQRPKALEQSKIAPAGTRFTFALGVLAFWQPGSPAADFSKTNTLALANPKLAPFGAAAYQALESLAFQPQRTVTASNISQAFSFAQSGAADSAFVSYSQLLQREVAAHEFILVDPQLYEPVTQQAIALNSNPQIAAFLAFCQGPEARATISAAGYRIP